MSKESKILLISLNFYPEDTAIGLYSTQMAEHLANKNTVEVLTAYPYYPKWEIFAGYENKNGYIKEERDGYKIHRRKQFIPKTINFKGRVYLMLSFTWNLVRMFFKPQKPDLVFCVIPFTLSCYIGWLYKVFYGSKLWIHVQDFEFDAAIESGLIKSKPLIWLLKRFEQFIFNRADQVSTISKSMMDKLHLPSRRKYLLPNWIDDSFYTEKDHQKHIIFQSTKNHFNILYSGNIGNKQDWDLFVDLAIELKNNQDIHFHIVGDGAYKNQLQESCVNKKNISFHNFVPFAELPRLLASADLHFLFQKTEVKDSVMPSKILGMLASGKPSIVTGNPDSEVKKVFDATGNLYFSEVSAQSIHQAILNIINHPADGQKSRQYVYESYNKNRVLNNLEQEINRIVACK